MERKVGVLTVSAVHDEVPRASENAVSGYCEMADPTTDLVRGLGVYGQQLSQECAVWVGDNDAVWVAITQRCDELLSCALSGEIISGYANRFRHGTQLLGLTTQAQRPGARGRTIATGERGPSSLQRLVERVC